MEQEEQVMTPRTYWIAYNRAYRRTRIALWVFLLPGMRTDSLRAYIEKQYQLARLINDRAQREISK